MRIVWIMVLILALLGIFIFLFTFFRITGNVVESWDRFYTKAICNETNYCEDYEIFCNGGELLRMSPTGNVVQFSEDWKDKRDESYLEKVC
ncbi:hypothetical protein HY448_02530 [Candidatus Pacearchaeota archaeon]|nr:hypothetical protein [Candidatus Pacearchaeota archaeon]